MTVDRTLRTRMQSKAGVASNGAGQWEVVRGGRKKFTGPNERQERREALASELHGLPEGRESVNGIHLQECGSAGGRWEEERERGRE